MRWGRGAGGYLCIIWWVEVKLVGGVSCLSELFFCKKALSAVGDQPVGNIVFVSLFCVKLLDVGMSRDEW